MLSQKKGHAMVMQWSCNDTIGIAVFGIAVTGIAVTGSAVTRIAVTGMPAVTGPHIRRYWLNNRDLGTENVWRVAPLEVTLPPPGDMVMQ